MSFQIDPLADVGESVEIGFGTKIWANAQIRENVKIGKNCVIGKDTYIGAGVAMGDNCKIQNGALIYEPANLGAGVFIGPGVILTNDQYPRAINPDKTVKSASDWSQVGVSISSGASIGAGAVCVAPIVIEEWAVVGAGAVVIRDVPKFALVVGNPAKQIGWVGKAGYRLRQVGNRLVCPKSREIYEIIDGKLEEVTSK